jgi:Uma2 family endonuclease
MLQAICVPEHTVGAEQFVYFDASAPTRCLAPDAFVTLGVPDHDVDSYLVWEEGTPELAFEVLSPSDTPERWTFEEKLRRYRALGVRELVTFHVDAGDLVLTLDEQRIAEVSARESAERARESGDERIRELEELLAAAQPRRDQ